uniref:Tyrosine-protein kinase ephrin type A/B receptor-like domain-containing protein n=1 Tax=Phaeomonas parva TaxID=124430 RepID=A0A7S1TV74_9STRA|mmetsp:Transcript_19409/g.58675  ORF Transcript_19409/g.58675 Transcript_19409/m.58675 type:complete len:256 (+) Transcript_19409:228-995(+)
MWRLLLPLAAALLPAAADLDHCKADCSDAARPVGPTRPPNTRGHPWFPAPNPNPYLQFCQTGCSLFFESYPVLTDCQAECDRIYRYDVTVAYNDQAEVARLECRDGCEMGLLRCQAGYYCTAGSMLQCPIGTYRDVDFAAVEACVDCPRGRYRSDPRGRYLESCAQCPVGKYVNDTGSAFIEDCLRCPAGKFAPEPGLALCKCITTKSFVGVSDDIEAGDYEYGSCEPGEVDDPTRENLFFKDPYKDTVPFTGRF